MSVSSVDTSDRNYLNLIGRNPDGTKKTDSKDDSFNAVFENKVDKSVKFDDFFNLMIKQLQNQDFMKPVDDTQYLSQLAQIAGMEAMQEVSKYTQANYCMSLLGKSVVATKYNIGGTATNDTGVITQVTHKNNEYKFTVNGNQYSMDEISVINNPTSSGSTTTGGSTGDSNTGGSTSNPTGDTSSNTASSVA